MQVEDGNCEMSCCGPSEGKGSLQPLFQTLLQNLMFMRMKGQYSSWDFSAVCVGSDASETGLRYSSLLSCAKAECVQPRV
jgi:hypothetical protein